MAGAGVGEGKRFPETDEPKQDLQLEARVAGSRTLQLGQRDSVLFPYPGFQSGFVEVNDSNQGNRKEPPTSSTGARKRK
ncbi:hypothetical protein ACLK1Z_17755 [Escherichia coli]